MRAGRGSTGEAAVGLLALAFVFGFTIIALAPLLKFGGSFSFDARIAAVLRFTVYQATLSTALSLVFGLVVALAVARRPHMTGRVWLVRFMAAPMGLPVLAGAFGILSIWGRQGIVNDMLSMLGLTGKIEVYGLTGILIAHTFFNIPLAARLFVAALDRAPPQYWLISASLGMRPLSIFRFVEAPLVMRAVPGAAGLIFMLCATSFTLVLILGGGPAATTLEVAIYQALKFDFEPARAVYLVVVQMALTSVVLAFLSRFSIAEEDRSVGSSANRRFDGASLPAKAWDSGVIILFLLYCGAPFVAIFLSGITASFAHVFADPLFWQAVGASFAIGIPAAVIAAGLGYAIALAGYGTSNRFFSASLQAGGSLILLAPPVVLATGWFLWLKGGSGLAPYILVALINALMALPFSLRMLEPAIYSHFERTGRLSESLGLQGLTRLRAIDLPALYRPILAAFFFSLALSLGDLGAVALFGGNSLVTLPWLIYARLGSYRTTDAAALTLLLAIVCMALAVLGTPGNGKTAEDA